MLIRIYQYSEKGMSRLDRNVPSFNSFKMSPLCNSFRITLLSHNSCIADFVVSCSLKNYKLSPVTLSTIFIRQHFSLLPSNESWLLPSNCTSSPNLARLSLRLRYLLRRLLRFHSPASISHLLRVSWSIKRPSL